MKRNSISCIKAVVLLGFLYLVISWVLGFIHLRNLDEKSPKHKNVDESRESLRFLDESHKLEGVLLKKNPEPLQEPNVAVALKDWTDLAFVSAERLRKGPGEHGQAVYTTKEEEEAVDELYKANGFNGYVSDKISLDRAIPDFRLEECKAKKYPSKLLNASVVIPFHNEHWTTLLRSVHSLINRTPPELLHEIVLADDYSHKPFLGQQLESYLADNYGGKVRVVRAERREGLIRARLMAAKQATGDVIVILDSHIEANTNWLPPLLAPITEDYRTVTCPCIDIIDYDNFSLRPDNGGPGVFDWELHFKTLQRSAESMKHPADKYKSPVMVGGLFAISRKWFWELGGYDPGLDIWGGEQYELSFKVWQCGGTMYNVPCSRVAHIYRKFAPFPNPGVGDFIARNYRRVAEVWMDEYAKYIYERQPHYKSVDPGDITEQLEVRERLQCKPFKWYMDEVAFQLLKHFPYEEPANLAEGEFRNKESTMCIDIKFKAPDSTFGVDTCVDDKSYAGAEQNLALTWRGELRPKQRDLCFDVPHNEVNAKIILYVCHGMRGNQKFSYNPETKQLFHSNTHKCIENDSTTRTLFMYDCDVSKTSQQWIIQTVRDEAVAQAWKERNQPF